MLGLGSKHMWTTAVTRQYNEILFGKLTFEVMERFLGIQSRILTKYGILGSILGIWGYNAF